MPRQAQFGAVETAQGPASNHRNFHPATKHAGKRFDNKKHALFQRFRQTILAATQIALYREGGFARAHGAWTYEPRQGRNAATAVCSASAVVALAFRLSLPY